MTTSFPSSPEPNSITRAADGDNGVPRVVTFIAQSKKPGRQYQPNAGHPSTCRPQPADPLTQPHVGHPSCSSDAKLAGRNCGHERNRTWVSRIEPSWA